MVMARKGHKSMLWRGLETRLSRDTPHFLEKSGEA